MRSKEALCLVLMFCSSAFSFTKCQLFVFSKWPECKFSAFAAAANSDYCTIVYKTLADANELAIDWINK